MREIIWVYYDGPLLSDRIGVGLVLANQELGITKDQFAQLGLAYAIINTDEMSVRLGFNMTMRHYVFDVNNPDIYVKDRQDPSLGIGTTSNPNPYYYNIGVGAYFDYKN